MNIKLSLALFRYLPHISQLLYMKQEFQYIQIKHVGICGLCVNVEVCSIIIHQFSDKRQFIILIHVSLTVSFTEFFILILVIKINLNFYLLNDCYSVTIWLVKCFCLNFFIFKVFQELFNRI